MGVAPAAPPAFIVVVTMRLASGGRTAPFPPPPIARDTAATAPPPPLTTLGGLLPPIMRKTVGCKEVVGIMPKCMTGINKEVAGLKISALVMFLRDLDDRHKFTPQVSKWMHRATHCHPLALISVTVGAAPVSPTAAGAGAAAVIAPSATPAAARATRGGAPAAAAAAAVSTLPPAALRGMDGRPSVRFVPWRRVRGLCMGWVRKRGLDRDLRLGGC